MPYAMSHRICQNLCWQNLPVPTHRPPLSLRQSLRQSQTNTLQQPQPEPQAASACIRPHSPQQNQRPTSTDSCHNSANHASMHTCMQGPLVATETMSLLKYFGKRARQEPASDSSDSEGEEATSGGQAEATGCAKQAVSFNQKWLVGRKWLTYEMDSGMFCLLCHKCPYNRDVWNKTACTRLRLQSILEHEKSGAHRDCIQLEAAAASSRNSQP